MKILIELHEDADIYGYARLLKFRHPKTVKSATVIPDSEYITSEQMEERLREAFSSGWKACESHFDEYSEIGGAPLQLMADYNDWRNKKCI